MGPPGHAAAPDQRAEGGTAGDRADAVSNITELPDGVWDCAWVVVVYTATGGRHYHRVFTHAKTGQRHADAALARGASRVEIVPVRLVPA